MGLGVLHNKCVEIAKDNDIKLIVRSSMSYDEGTIITNYRDVCKLPKVTGVTSCDNVVSIIGTNIDNDTINKITDVLNENHFKYDNLNFNNMEICMSVPSNEINSCVNCVHNIFF